MRGGGGRREKKENWKSLSYGEEKWREERTAEGWVLLIMAFGWGGVFG